MNKEKQLTIALLTEKLQNLTGKKIVLREGDRTAYIKGNALRERINKVLAKAGFEDRKDFFVSVDSIGEIKANVYNLDKGEEMAIALKTDGLQFKFNKENKTLG